MRVVVSNNKPNRVITSGSSVVVKVQPESSNRVVVGSSNNLTAEERTKLAGIEANADVTDTANVTSAGAVMYKSEQIVDETLNGFVESVYDQGTITSGPVRLIDLADGNVQTLTIGTNLAISFTDSRTTLPAVNLTKVVTLVIENGGDYTVSFTNVKWPGGVAPTLSEESTDGNGIDIVSFLLVEQSPLDDILYGFVGGLNFS